MDIVPAALHLTLRNSTYVSKSGMIVIQADDSRKQSDNVNTCFKRLHETVLKAGRDCIPGETSAEKSKHVKAMYGLHFACIS